MSDTPGFTGDWAIGTWHCYIHAELHFVFRHKGKPALDFGATPTLYDAYRWNSYHAAAKFKRENPCLMGYIIVNLSEIKAQCEKQKEIDRKGWAIVQAEEAAKAVSHG